MSINITVPGSSASTDRDFGYGYSPGAVRYATSCASIRESATVYADTYIVGPYSYSWRALADGGLPSLDNGTELTKVIALPGVETGALVLNQNWGDCIYRVDFATPGVYDSISGARGELVTVTRNSTAKFVVDGTEYTAAANQARVGRNGLIVEPGCTNLAPTPTNLTSASWQKNGLTTSAYADPLGGTSATLFTESSGSAQRYVFTDVVAGRSGKHANSIYAKAVGANKRWLMIDYSDNGTRRCIFDLVTGTFTNTGTAVPEMEEIGNGWWRCSLNFASTTGVTQNLTLGVCNASNSWGSYSGDGASGIALWRPQVEASNDYATTWQNTGDVRAAEIATSVVPAFTDPHGVEAVVTPCGAQYWVRGAVPVLSFGTKDGADTIALRMAAGDTQYSIVDSGSAAKYSATGVNARHGTRTLFGASSGKTQPIVYYDGIPSPGAAVGTGTGMAWITLPASRNMRIGSDSTGLVGGFCFRSIAIYASATLPPIEQPYNVLAHAVASEATAAANRIAFVGHSWVEGTGSETIAERYTHKTARLLGSQYAECNYGIGTNTSSQTLDICRRYVWRHGYKRVSIDCVINDVGGGYPAAVILANIATIVAEAKAAGATKVVVVNGAPGSANNAVTLAVNAGLTANATAWGCTVVDSYTEFNDPGNPGHMKATHGDGLHATQVGMDALAALVAAALA